MRHAAKLLLLSALLATAAACVHSQTGVAATVGCRGGHERLAGHYYLNGVMEVGSELLLRKDGSFEFMLAYGANDQYGKGCWAQDGSKISLVPRRPQPRQRPAHARQPRLHRHRARCRRQRTGLEHRRQRLQGPLREIGARAPSEFRPSLPRAG
ncbi:hypothetical protein [Mesorhizobium sp. J428]|uniref:hypothetical protein n=1 Tax=Mesorhizobium sp. J428 TaxID=2898440 RepID=UPI0021512F53|nr:hypothetical protein [Mesorhizobium sp. J428]MCR5858506.1 hypothetical protein [Mesorhizobium sp. J428]